jgi:hypothetical protein
MKRLSLTALLVVLIVLASTTVALAWGYRVVGFFLSSTYSPYDTTQTLKFHTTHKDTGEVTHGKIAPWINVLVLEQRWDGSSVQYKLRNGASFIYYDETEVRMFIIRIQHGPENSEWSVYYLNPLEKHSYNIMLYVVAQ